MDLERDLPRSLKMQPGIIAKLLKFFWKIHDAPPCCDRTVAEP